MKLVRRTPAAWVAIGALVAGGLGACGSGNNLNAETPTTRHGGRFPVAVVSTTTPEVTTPFGAPVGAPVTTTATTTRAARTTSTVPGAPGLPTTLTTIAPRSRTRPSPTPMPSPRTGVGSVAWQGLVVVAGGTDASGRPSPRVDAYDPGNGVWTRAPDLPQALRDVALAVQADELWAVGGFAAQGDQSIAQATTYHFHPGDSVWKTGPLLQTPRGGVALGALNDTLIVIGGATTDGGTLDSVETLGLGDGGWKAGTPLAQKRAYASAIVVGGRIFALGGRAEGVATALDNVESWKPGDTWRAEQPLVTKRSGAGASALCIGGGENSDGAVGTIECLAAREWTTKFRMTTPRRGLAVVALDGWLHLVAGGPSPGSTVYSAHEVFDLGG